MHDIVTFEYALIIISLISFIINISPSIFCKQFKISIICINETKITVFFNSEVLFSYIYFALVYNIPHFMYFPVLIA